MTLAISYRVLARKYRPKTLSELVGQDMLVQTLTQSIKQNRIPHAFLLHGIRGVGKTTTARIIAKALNCTGVDGKGEITPEPCGVCSSCTSITEDRHLDVIEMDAASRTGVDDIREVIESSRYKAVNGRFKVFIIDEVHMLSKSAFNALLKTLEEPPPHVKFIFATTEIRKIPDTIISRCMRFDLKRMEPLTLVKHFQNIAAQENIIVDEEAMAAIVRAADGSARDGLSLLDQAIALSGDHVTSEAVRGMLGLMDRNCLFQLAQALFSGDVTVSLTLIRDLLNQGADATTLLLDILDLVYWLTCFKSSPQLGFDPTWPESERQQSNKIATQLSLPALMRAWQILSKGYEEVSRAPLPNQALEMVLVRLCYISDMPSVEEIVQSLQSSHNDKARSGAPTPAFSPPPSPTPPQRQQPAEPIVTASATLPQSFQEMVKLVEDAKEPLLYSHLLHDIHLVSFNPGHLTIRLSSHAPQNFPQSLQSILVKATKSPWKIDVVTTGGNATMTEQKQEHEQKKTEESLNHPVVKEIMAAFPEATVIKKN